jgi:hypothetical protein
MKTKPIIYPNEGIFKQINDAFEKINHENFIIKESWKKELERLKKEFPNSKIKYSYKTKQFTIKFNLPHDYMKIKGLIFNT